MGELQAGTGSPDQTREEHEIAIGAERARGPQLLAAGYQQQCWLALSSYLLAKKLRIAKRMAGKPLEKDCRQVDGQPQVVPAVDGAGCRIMNPSIKALVLNRARRKAYESCSRTRHEQFVAD